MDQATYEKTMQILDPVAGAIGNFASELAKGLRESASTDPTSIAAVYKREYSAALARAIAMRDAAAAAGDVHLETVLRAEADRLSKYVFELSNNNATAIELNKQISCVRSSPSGERLIMRILGRIVAVINVLLWAGWFGLIAYKLLMSQVRYKVFQFDGFVYGIVAILLLAPTFLVARSVISGRRKIMEFSLVGLQVAMMIGAEILVQVVHFINFSAFTSNV